jgi:hypothetical protein
MKMKNKMLDIAEQEQVAYNNDDMATRIPGNQFGNGG